MKSKSAPRQRRQPIDPSLSAVNRAKERKRRNRVAAQRIRDRKKLYEEELKEKADELQLEQSSLQEQIEALEVAKLQMRRDIGVYRKVMQFGLTVDPSLINDPDALVAKLKEHFATPATADSPDLAARSESVAALSAMMATANANDSMDTSSEDACSTDHSSRSRGGHDDDTDNEVDGVGAMMMMDALKQFGCSAQPLPLGRATSTMTTAPASTTAAAAAGTTTAAASTAVGSELVDACLGNSASHVFGASASRENSSEGHPTGSAESSNPLPSGSRTSNLPLAMLATMVALSLCSPSQTRTSSSATAASMLAQTLLATSGGRSAAAAVAAAQQRASAPAGSAASSSMTSTWLGSTQAHSCLLERVRQAQQQQQQHCPGT